MAEESDPLLRWFATVAFLGILGWIGLNIADIPVIKTEIVQIKEGIGVQLQISLKRLEDHEERIRILEKQKR